MTEPWIERWQERRTGWHESGGNAGLRRHWRVSGRRVLVPLCGKTPDLKWLAERGNEVIGVELSEIAIQAFFEEQGLIFEIEDGVLPAWRAQGAPITIYLGDYFALSGIRCDAHYDRAALVALPAELRPAYAAHTQTLLIPGAEQLVVTVEYEQSLANGPPYSVPAQEVLRYWPDLQRVDVRDDIDNGPPKFRQAGLREMLEVVWRSP
jgi:thiopurine S-methyltransferase